METCENDDLLADLHNILNKEKYYLTSYCM